MHGLCGKCSPILPHLNWLLLASEEYVPTTLHRQQTKLVAFQQKESV